MTLFDPVNFCGFYIIGVLVVCLIVAKHAPYGWEDKDGFHYGRRGKR